MVQFTGIGHSRQTLAEIAWENQKGKRAVASEKSGSAQAVSSMPDVCVGSIASFRARLNRVRSTPITGPSRCRLALPRSANRRHHLVGAGEDRGGHRDANRLRGLHADHQLKPRRLLDRDFGGATALTDLVDIARGAASQVEPVRVIGEETSDFDAILSLRHQPGVRNVTVITGTSGLQVFRFFPGSNPIGAYIIRVWK